MWKGHLGCRRKIKDGRAEGEGKGSPVVGKAVRMLLLKRKGRPELEKLQQDEGL